MSKLIYGIVVGCLVLFFMELVVESKYKVRKRILQKLGATKYSVAQVFILMVALLIIDSMKHIPLFYYTLRGTVFGLFGYFILPSISTEKK